MTVEVNDLFNTGDKNLDRMNRDLYRFAHADAMGGDPRVIDIWVRR